MKISNTDKTFAKPEAPPLTGNPVGISSCLADNSNNFIWLYDLLLHRRKWDHDADALVLLFCEQDGLQIAVTEPMYSCRTDAKFLIGILKQSAYHIEDPQYSL